jgi:sigma-B regulation protein RsbU (phosphoserine phosphatase)
VQAGVTIKSERTSFAESIQIKVLIVDDSKLQRKIISASLLRMGYEVREADSGQTALDICEIW